MLSRLSLLRCNLYTLSVVTKPPVKVGFQYRHTSFSPRRMSVLDADPPNLFGFLETLLLCSEKAATIARMMKLEYKAFQSLVQQKCNTEANSRFAVDVKTLADVLIQEVIRFDLEKVYPGFGSSVYGEEDNQFYSENKNETLVIRMTDSEEEVASLLCRIFGQSNPLALALSEIATRPLDCFRNADSLDQFRKDVHRSEVEHLKSTSVQLSDYALWIDPLGHNFQILIPQLFAIPDSTAEYVRCPFLVKTHDNSMCIQSDDLPLLRRKYSYHRLEIPGQLVNVTVLLGVFGRAKGDLLLGIVNQPFYISPSECPRSNRSSHLYSGRLFWGINASEPVASPTCLPFSEESPTIRSSELHLQLPNRLLDCAQTVCGTGPMPIGLRVACSSVEFNELRSAFKTWPRTTPRDTLTEVILFSSPGAGFKLLCVIMGEVDAYLVWKPNTFWWDTCAPHAILNAVNGGVVSLRSAIQLTRQLIRSSSENTDAEDIKSMLISRLGELQVRYSGKSNGHIKGDNSLYCNTEGFMAYRSKNMAVDILIYLAKNMPEE
ncbi:hypothetical protein D915_000216 [Fasciola hepatica]|uniref:Inositol polyphosphate 1-phosphatase n=1 Tax=Fasciola hepatica TaxID=6192 RepID=A0A4E0S0I9_FASHE|nr:hypothetical protein D915_000216 [Fasciola hepatica]